MLICLPTAICPSRFRLTVFSIKQTKIYSAELPCIPVQLLSCTIWLYIWITSKWYSIKIALIIFFILVCILKNVSIFWKGSIWLNDSKKGERTYTVIIHYLEISVHSRYSLQNTCLKIRETNHFSIY